MSEEKLDLFLIREVQKGNKQAFDALVLKYQYRVFNIVSKYISDPVEASDVAQETFIKLYKAIDKFRGDSAFYTWLYRISINTAKNYLLKQGKHFNLVNFEISDIEQFISKHVSKEYSTPERDVLDSEVETILFKAIKNLPTDLRTTILLKEIDGLTYTEIAKVMDCPVGTVRSRIFRAKNVIDKKVLSNN